MPEIIPHLDQSMWEINGDSLTAWVNDLEMFDIFPSPTHEDLWLLHYNHVGLSNATFLGSYGRISDAQGAAKDWLGDNDG